MILKVRLRRVFEDLVSKIDFGKMFSCVHFSYFVQRSFKFFKDKCILPIKNSLFNSISFFLAMKFSSKRNKRALFMHPYGNNSKLVIKNNSKSIITSIAIVHVI